MSEVAAQKTPQAVALLSWGESPLGELTDIAIGGTPSRDIGSYWASDSAEGFPWVAISDLHGRVITKTKEQITESGVRNSNVKLVTLGTVMMSFKLSLGRVAFAGCDLFTNEAIAAFKTRDHVVPEFLFYVLPEAVRTAATDVAIKGATLNKESLRALRIPYPAIPVQQKIATILTAIDTTIEKTEALIDKYRQIKAGLMHDLFTRGVLPNGQLRPPRSEAPELYQETAIGWIPKEWEVVTLRSCLTEGATNGLYKPAELIGEGSLMVGQTAFTTERSIDFSFCRRGQVDDFELKKYGLVINDILLTRVFATVQGVGLPTLVPELSEPAVFESNMMRLRINENIAKSHFLFEWLRTSQVRRIVEGVANASNQASVNQRVLNPLPVPLPDLAEQMSIIEVIAGMDRLASIEKVKLTKLRDEKLGLMQDLLTGKVPVTPQEKEIRHA